MFRLALFRPFLLARPIRRGRARRGRRTAAIWPLVSLTAPTRANAAQLVDGSPPGPPSPLQVGVGLLPTGRGAATVNALAAIPGNAQLHYIIKDEQGTVVLDDYQSADPTQPLNWQQLQVGLRLQQAGTVELRVETVDALNPDVFVDDVRLDHTQSTIVQEQHSYAYGAPMLGLNYVVGATRYRHGYQGQYAEIDAETGTDDFELRNYDSRIGRWTAPDPYGQYASPYMGMGNNPVSSVDPDGGFAFSSLLPMIQCHLLSLGANISKLAVAIAPSLPSVGIGAASTAVRAAQQGPGKPSTVAPRDAVARPLGIPTYIPAPPTPLVWTPSFIGPQQYYVPEHERAMQLGVEIGGTLESGYGIYKGGFRLFNLYNAANTATKTTRLLSQFNSVESLLQEASAGGKVGKGIVQMFVPGDGRAIVQSITRTGKYIGGKPGHPAYLLPDGTIIRSHISSVSGAFTIDIKRAGIIYKIRTQ